VGADLGGATTGRLTLHRGKGNGPNEGGQKGRGTVHKETGENLTRENGDSPSGAGEPVTRPAAVPSAILEKGVVYFFLRARVDMSSAHQPDDIARTYLLLRPLKKDAALGAGPIGDAGNARLLALPKKVLPRSGRERHMAFVEKAGVDFALLRDDFLSGSEYETKTRGTRHTPAATPVGEGVYALTSTDKDSHLAYILTLPEKLGEVQRGVGLRERGSWRVSTRNPEFSAPKGAKLPQGPEYPKASVAILARSTLGEFDCG